MAKVIRPNPEDDLMEQGWAFFSIIIPTYNRPKQLANCLSYLAALDYPRHRFEVIVVDDGSDRPPDEVISSFGQQLQLTLLTKDNAGPAAARNTGSAMARGRFLAFTDDDCAVAPNWLKVMASHFATLPNQAIAGRTVNALTHNPFSAASQTIIDLVHAHYNADPSRAQFLASNNLALPADIFRNLGGFDETFRTSEDRDLCDRWLHHGHRLTYAPEAVVCHFHDLNCRSFWQQHFSYGRGAFRYHRSRARRGSGPFRPDFKFYLRVLRQIVKHGTEKQVLLKVLLLVLWQLANTSGFMWETILVGGENGCRSTAFRSKPRGRLSAKHPLIAPRSRKKSES